MFVWLLVLVSSRNWLPFAGCERVLLLPFPLSVGNTSHHLLMGELGYALAERGHQVDILVHRNSPATTRKVNPIYLDSKLSAKDSAMLEEALHHGLSRRLFGFRNNTFENLLFNFARSDCEQQLSNGKLQSKLASNNYSIIVTDFFNHCGYLQSKRLNKSYITFECSFGYSLMTDGRMIAQLAHLPVQKTGYSDSMSFFERTKNGLHFIANIFDDGYWNRAFQAINSKLGVNNQKSVAQIRRESQLFLVNNHFALEFARPLPPNLKFVGGMAIQPPKVDKYVHDFLSGAGKSGCIVVGFESNLFHVPRLCEVFLGALQLMPQKVLWQSGYDIKMANPRVMSIKNLPPGVLGHPNVRLFVTHGGINDILESLYYGVPIFAVPVFEDAPDLMARLQKKNVGRWTEFLDLRMDKLAETLLDMLNDSTLKENARRSSVIMRTEPLPPKARAAAWVEHVLKVGDGGHLYSKVNDMSYVRLHMLDVMFYYCIIAMIYVLFVYVMVRLHRIEPRLCKIVILLVSLLMFFFKISLMVAVWVVITIGLLVMLGY